MRFQPALTMLQPLSLLWLGVCCLFFWTGTARLQAQDARAATVLPPPAAKPAPAPRQEFLDLPYVQDGQERQRLDLYLPAAPPDSKGRPLVVWVHGGGWESGSKLGCPAKQLVGRGYAVASIGYRLSQQAVFPAQIEDCKAAIRWLRAHAAEYSIDPSRIGAWGESAGGHLVALLGTTGGTRQFDVGGNLDKSSAVQCVLDWFGPADFLVWGDPPVDATSDTAATPIAHLLGGTIRTHEALARAASPVYFVGKDAAPFLIMHGDRDGLVPLQQSRELDAALQKAGVESTLKVLPGAVHGGAAFRQPDNLLLTLDFFDRHLHPAVR